MGVNVKRISKLTSALIITVALLMVVPTESQAQLPQMRLTVLAPAGGQVGTTVDVTLVAGDLLEDSTQLHFSHPGITATPKRVSQNGVDTVVPKTFQVTIAPDVPAGIYDVVCRGRWGISNPKRFIVGQRPEISEPENHQTASTAAPINVGQVVHGSIAGSHEVDWYQFPAKKGNRVVIDCLTSSIDSPLNAALTLFDASGRRRLAVSRQYNRRDALLVYDVPNDGQFLLKVHDVTYRSGADYQYRLDLHTGPFIEYVSPPQVLPGPAQRVAVYGHHLPGGRPSGVIVQNVELQVLDVDMTVPDDWQTQVASQLVSPFQASADTFPWRITSATASSNAVSMGIATAPVLSEHEPNDASAQTVSIPVSIAGQFGTPEGRDRFRFQGTKGQKLSIDVISERLGNAVDALVVIERVVIKPDMTEQLVPVVTHDDTAPNLNAKFFETQTSDPSFLVDLPETATYQLTIRNRIGNPRGIARQQYQLEIREAKPDFIAVAIPGMLQQGQITPVSLRQQDRIPVTVYVFRRDGFAGEIRIEQVGDQKVLQSEATVIPPDKNVTTFILTANSLEGQQNALVNLQLDAVATLPAVADQAPMERRHPVRFATMIHPQNNNVSAICRLTSHQTVGIHPEAAPLQLTSSIAKFNVAQGSIIQLPIDLRRSPAAQEAVQLTIPLAPPATKIVAGTETIPKDAVSGILQLQLEDNVAPGLHPFWINGESQVSYRKKPELVDQAQAALDQFKQELALIEAEHKKQEQAKKAAQQKVADAASQVAASEKSLEALKTSAEQTEANSSEASLAAAEQQVAAAKELLKVSEELLQKAIAAEQAAIDALKKKDEVQKRLETQLEAATKGAQPNSLKASAPSQMIFLNIVPAVVKMTASTLQTTGIVAGKTMPVAIQLQRLKDFKEAVTIRVIDRAAGAQLTAEPIVIPADQTTGTVTLTSPTDISIGARTLVLQATATNAGQETTFEIPFPVTTVAATP